MDAPEKTYSTDLDQSDDVGQKSEVVYWKSAYFWKGIMMLVIFYGLLLMVYEWIAPWVPDWLKLLLTPKGLPVFPKH